MNGNLNRWDVSFAEAKSIQERLRPRVITRDRLRRVRSVAGVDVAFDKSRALARAAVAVLSFPDLELRDRAVVEVPTRFPYVPGYLSFREMPAICEALAKLERAPDMLVCDGQGYAHPRRFGLACHLGVATDTPCIGVGKTRLIGAHAPVPDERGAWTELLDGEEVIGAVLRSRARVRPIFVSIGHRVSLSTAIDYVLACTTRYRLPETTRWADRLSKSLTAASESPPPRSPPACPAPPPRAPSPRRRR